MVSLSSAATVRMVGRATIAPQWLTARWSLVVGALVVLPHLVAGQQAVDLGTASLISKYNPKKGVGVNLTIFSKIAKKIKFVQP